MATFLGMKYATPLEIYAEEVVMRSESLNLKISTFETGASRWEIKATMSPVNNLYDPAGTRLSIHSNLHGMSKAFTIEMPQLIGTSPVEGTITAVGEWSGDDEIEVETSDVENVAAGRFISFQGNPKVYQVTEDAVIDGTGVLKIFPKLVADVNQNSVVNFSPDIQVYYAKRHKHGVKYTAGILTKAKVAFSEALV